MRLRQVVGLVLVTAVTVVATDLAMNSALLRMVRPIIVAPPDGAITKAPVVVRWEGPQELLATLTGSGLRVDLGLRQSPFQIDGTYFPRPGQYSIQLQSPMLGRLASVQRRFLLPKPVEKQPPISPTETCDSCPAPEDALAGLRAERDRVRADNVVLRKDKRSLELENDRLANTLEELRELNAQTDERLELVEQQHAELVQGHLLTEQENEALRLRLQSIPPCTAWGYLVYPRPQTSPPTRRVVVSDRRGQVFQSDTECMRARRTDPTAASPCVCVGLVWGHP